MDTHNQASVTMITSSKTQQDGKTVFSFVLTGAASCPDGNSSCQSECPAVLSSEAMLDLLLHLLHEEP